MYHTFRAATSLNSIDGGEGGKGRPGGSRRISTSNACVECRRRKIRCDGAQPCGQCNWYQHPELCAYSKPAQRIVPSRKLLDKLQTQVDQYHAVFAKLFPGKELEDFVPLPRSELINLAVTLPATTTSPGHTPDPLPGVPVDPLRKSDGADSLEGLEQAPELDPATDEVKRLKDKIQGISDDVNGLSLSVDKASSYVGVSSINAAMKVMFKTAPMARSFLVQAQEDESAEPSRSSTPPPHTLDQDPHYLPPADIGEKLIDSYFAHIHVLMPMIDEDHFRQSYLYGSRRDSPWLTLLNMVFALGCLASSTCDNEGHMAYYQRARKHMEVETFGSGSLYVLQAFGLLSGYYLHWLNRPNEANGIMGATLRMATAHGLHREYSESRRADTSAGSGGVVLSNSEVPVEIRRRTWWSLYILDSWASITTGRPSLGRTGRITVQHPRIPEQMNNAQYLASLRLLPIIHNITFCKIATKVQDILAEKSFIEFEELFALDAELEKWHDELPPILHDVLERPQLKKRQSSRDYRQTSPKPATSTASNTNPFDFSQPPDRDKTACPEVLKTPRAIMHWRYQNLKLLMHRPVLLTTALRRTAWTNMSSDERLAVGRCRIVASQAIADIDATCKDDLIAGWNGVWMMYQAVMVPLLSLFSVLSMPPNLTFGESPLRTPGSDSSLVTPGSDDDTERWHRDIERSISFFDRMQPWSIAAKKSRDVVQNLHDATRYVAEHNARYHQQQQEILQRRMSMVVPDTSSFAAQSVAEPAAETPTQYANGLSYAAPDIMSFMNNGWGISPNGEAAMNEFWDDMMWDTFPSDVPNSASANFEGIAQTDWWPQVNGDQDWAQWNGGANAQ
ncbi:Lactose regulatory protein LAC9 [Pseudocercospora fuligena]|uniref:Lactose regulatory protein LAC9 n=1 Tax=Pseudocercospora fuligena TaxID=685502 RepID=A0A8H6RNQ1_9PEZI|nr:Lactose regulatory protein LAC9 [Pseudocercospora fuligena]